MANKLSLTAARVNEGLTIEQLSRETGISKPTIIKYEKGKVSPKWSNLKKIITRLNVSVDDLDL